jgi:hypothetical protein
MNIEQAQELTGFVKCEFPPDNDPCESCGKTNLQHYFQGPIDAGRYFCEECVIEEALDNQYVSQKEKNETKE